MNFFSSFFLWKEAVIATFVLSIALSTVGTYTVLRRVVFLPASLSQLSGLGVMISFWIMHVTAMETAHAHAFPLVIAFVLTFLGAMAVARISPSFYVSRETMIGIVYILSSALVLLLANILPQESHHVDNILFGNAVLVDNHQMYIAIAVAAAVLLLHGIFRSRFMFISFDSETATAHGLPMKRLDGILFLTMAMVITVSTKTIGALPTFAFSLLPPWFAVQRFNKTSGILIAGAVVAALSSFAGYWLSFELDTPTGATTTTFTGIFSAALLLIPKSLFGKKENR